MDISYDLKQKIEKIIGYTITPMTMTEKDLLDVVDDLITEYENLEEKYQNLEQDLEDNYKPISASEMYDIDDKDFI